MSRELPESVLAPAKLNLCLYVGPRRDDGLHEIRSLFEPLELADELRISEAPEDEVICEGVSTQVAWAGEVLSSKLTRMVSRPARYITLPDVQFAPSEGSPAEVPIPLGAAYVA